MYNNARSNTYSAKKVHSFRWHGTCLQIHIMTPTVQSWELGLLLPLIILLAGLQAATCGAWAQILARARGHSGLKWFWLGFFLSVVGVIWASKLPDFFYGGECRRRNLCSGFCALVNGCNGNEPKEVM